jgi:hypothetical protein
MPSEDGSREIARPIEFTRRLDTSEARAIEKRLAELEPYVAEHAALRRRLESVRRRLGVESAASMVDRSIVTLLTEHQPGLSRNLIIRDLGLPIHVVKSSLERLVRRGRIISTERGYYRLRQ